MRDKNVWVVNQNNSKICHINPISTGGGGLFLLPPFTKSEI